MDLISKLEDRNGELAKEILLNESAIFEVQFEIRNIDPDLANHPTIGEYISRLNQLMENLDRINETYKAEIFENELKIKKLRSNENE